MEEHRTTGTRSKSATENKSMEHVLSDLKKESPLFVKAIQKWYKSRFMKFKPVVNSLIDQSFRLDNMVRSAEEKVVPDSFYRYYRLASQSRYTDAVLSEVEVGHQYLAMAELAKFEYDKIRPGRRDDLSSLEKEVFEKVLCSCPTERIDFAADLLASAIVKVRTHTESVVESMGSRIKVVSDNRALKFVKRFRKNYIPYSAGVDKLVEKQLICISKLILRVESGIFTARQNKLHC
ncbi:unnamed protein product [Orchesella dallaii]|uniref:Uncharacterized protein n=1 Tax=Orchesella dallaii TaxID=48710 RepID=A0ABP1RMA1_9HEXA